MQVSNTKPASIRVRLGARITIVPRGKNGNYVADFSFDGKHRRKSLKTRNLKIARERAVHLEVDLGTGEFHGKVKRTTIEDALTRYIESLRALGRAKKTIIAYQAECRSFSAFLQESNTRQLHQISAQHFYRYRLQRQEKLTTKTLYTRLVILKTWLNWCCGAGEMLSTSPFRSIKVEQPHEQRQFTPTQDQVEKLISATKGMRLYQLSFLAFSGLRVSEMAMLRPQDVELIPGWIRIHAHDGWTPKTRQIRNIPIHIRLRAMLGDYSKQFADFSSRSFFFSDRQDGQSPINVRTLNVELQAVAKSVAVPVGRKRTGFVVHSLRHYFETSAVAAGVPQFVVDEWMGHSGGGHMGARYYGFSSKKSAEFMDTIKF